MQEEVAKHTKKIYKAVTTPGHTFLEKLKEIAIEIFIIVFAVTLSIWLHSWSDHRHEQKEATEFLKGLKENITEDLKQIEENKQTTLRLDSNYIFIAKHAEDPKRDTSIDAAIAHRLYYELRTTHPNSGRYEGFKSSGKMETIENDSLKQNILEYYQQTLPNLNSSEDIANSFQSRIMEMQINSKDDGLHELIRTFKFRALMSFGTQNLEENIRHYNETAALAKKIITEIDSEMH